MYYIYQSFVRFSIVENTLSNKIKFYTPRAHGSLYKIFSSDVKITVSRVYTQLRRAWFFFYLIFFSNFSSSANSEEKISRLREEKNTSVRADVHNRILKFIRFPSELLKISLVKHSNGCFYIRMYEVRNPRESSIVSLRYKIGRGGEKERKSIKSDLPNNNNRHIYRYINE